MSLNTFLGIASETWVNIDDECQMSHEVNRGEAQIDLGHRTASLHLVMTERGIGKLLREIEKVLRELHDELAARAPAAVADLPHDQERCDRAVAQT
jgi:hypothetical protein